MSASEDGSVLIKKMKVQWYNTRPAKTKGVPKQPIYGTMLKAEAPESEKGRRKYIVDKIDVYSEHVYRVFDPNIYLVKVGKDSALTKLDPTHVKEVCQFAVTTKRYLSYLRSQE